MDYLTPIAALIVAIAAVAYVVVVWINSTKEEKRAYIYDLVEAAEQLFADADGSEKLNYVLSEFEKKFPFAKAQTLRPLIEAAVRRIKGNRAWMEIETVESTANDPGESSRWN